jgi:hypothetical protein
MSTATKPVKPADLTARLAVFPSDEIRPIPPFVFSIPEGWTLDEGPDALAVVRTVEEHDGFWVNLMVSHDRVARAVDFKAAAQATWVRVLQASPTAVVSTERMVRFGDRTTYIRAVDLPAPSSKRPLAQLHALFFAPSEDGESAKTLDMFQLIGTCPAPLADTFGPSFLQIIGSFRFTSGTR